MVHNSNARFFDQKPTPDWMFDPEWNFIFDGLIGATEALIFVCELIGI